MPHRPGMTGVAHCVFATRGGVAWVMNWVASSMAVPSGVGIIIQNGTSMRVPAIGANGDLDIALGGEVFDHGAVRDVARDRREIHRADHDRAMIALLGLDGFHALEIELEVVAHAAVENAGAGAAGVRR